MKKKDSLTYHGTSILTSTEPLKSNPSFEGHTICV